MEKLNEVEDFIEILLDKNKCENIFVWKPTHEIASMGNWFPLEDFGNITYSKIENCIVVETKTEYCMIYLNDDHMESFDKEVD